LINYADFRIWTFPDANMTRECCPTDTGSDITTNRSRERGPSIDWAIVGWASDGRCAAIRAAVAGMVLSAIGSGIALKTTYLDSSSLSHSGEGIGVSARRLM